MRDYLYIDDAVNAYYLTMKSLIKGKKNLRIYNVGSKYNMNVFKMINTISKIVNKNDIKIKILNSSKKEILSQKLNYNKICKELKWKQTVNLENGLKKTLSWYKSNINFFKD